MKIMRPKLYNDSALIIKEGGFGFANQKSVPTGELYNYTSQNSYMLDKTPASLGTFDDGLLF